MHAADGGAIGIYHALTVASDGRSGRDGGSVAVAGADVEPLTAEGSNSTYPTKALLATAEETEHFCGWRQ